MNFFQETTQWSGDAFIKNHIYLLSDNKSEMYGYVPYGKTAVFEFKKTIRFFPKGRMFKEVRNSFGYREKKTTLPTWNVEGSKGATYTVTQGVNGYFCTCPGFQFRGKCKHIEQIGKTK